MPLCEILQGELGQGTSSVYQSLSLNAYIMAKWCSPDYLVNDNCDVLNMIQRHRHLPCGYTKIIQGMSPSDHFFFMNIIKELVTQIRFLLRVMDYTSNCLYSSYLKVCVSQNRKINWNCENNLVYCGYRKPWEVTLNYSKEAVVAGTTGMLWITLPRNPFKLVLRTF